MIKILSVCLLIAAFLSLNLPVTPAKAQAAVTGQPKVNQTIYLPNISKNVMPHSSTDLIDEALANGQITPEMAIQFRVFAGFGDSRLPEIYKGDPTSPSKEPDMDMIQSQFNNLTPQTQAALAPFFIPPPDPDSWVNLPSSVYQSNTQPILMNLPPAEGDWKFEINVNEKVKVWWDRRSSADQVTAFHIVNQLNTKIWALTSVDNMNVEPVSDEGKLRSRGKEFDIYLVHNGKNGTFGFTDSYPISSSWGLDCPKHASFILINLDLSIGGDLDGTVAHEFFHALQNAYDLMGSCGSYHWWKDATATWAEFKLYPQSPSTLEYPSEFLTHPDWSLSDERETHAYGAFLFPLYLSNILGQPDLIRKSWEKMATNDVFSGIDAVIPNGFKGTWPKFVQYLWNKGPVPNYNNYGIHDSVDLEMDSNLDLSSQGSKSIDMPVNLLPLTSTFFHFSGIDANIRSMAIYNPFYDPSNPSANPDAHIQAWVKYEGKPWNDPGNTIQDLSGKRFLPFCLDKKSERVEEMMIIISNSAFTPDSPPLNPAQKPQVRMTNIGCYAYTGNFTTKETRNENLSLFITNTITGTETLKVLPPNPLIYIDSLYSKLQFDTSTLQVSVVGHAKEVWGMTCEGDYSLSETFSLNPGGGYPLNVYDPYNLKGIDTREYYLYGSNSTFPWVYLLCDTNPPQYVRIEPKWNSLVGTWNTHLYISASGIITGTNVYDASDMPRNINYHYENSWTFTPQRQP